MNKERIVVAIGLILMFLRTSEAMVPYSPHSIFGLRGDWIGYTWAYLAAGLVEGVLWIGYNKLRTLGKDSNTKWTSLAVMIISFAFSAVMNVIDVRTLNGTLVVANGTPEMDFLVNAIVLVPGIAVAMFMAIEIIDAQFADNRGGGHSNKKSNSQQHFRPQASQRPTTPLPQPRGLVIPPPSEEMERWEEELMLGNSNGHSNDRKRDFGTEVPGGPVSIVEQKRAVNPTSPRSANRPQS